MKTTLLFFIVLNITNVIIQTVKSIATIKASKLVAALVNAVAYGLYTVVLIYMNADLPLATKAIIVALANLVGVYIVKAIEEKKQKDMLWKVELSVKLDDMQEVVLDLEQALISHNYTVVGNWVMFNTYCENKEETQSVKQIVNQYNAKYFVSETRVL